VDKSVHIKLREERINQGKEKTTLEFKSKPKDRPLPNTQKMSQKPVLFKDLNKRLSDLLTKEFPLENKVEWKGETANGVIVETNLVQRNGSVVGTFTPKYKYKDYGADFLFELNTKKEFKAEISLTDQIIKGLKLIVTGNSKGEELWVTTGTEYKNDFGTFTAAVDYGKDAGSTVKGSGTFGTNGWALGASTEYFFGSDSSELKEFNTVLSYETPEFAVTGFGRMKNGPEEKNEVGVTYFHVVNNDLRIGSEVSFDHANAEAKPKLVFGTQYKLNKDTLLKGKFDTNGQLGLSWGQIINDNARVVVSGSVDTNNLNGKNSSKLGFTLSLAN